MGKEEGKEAANPTQRKRQKDEMKDRWMDEQIERKWKMVLEVAGGERRQTKIKENSLIIT